MAAAGLLSLVYTAFAYFDDTEASTDNSFTVGVWALEVEDGDELEVEGSGKFLQAYTFQGLNIGDSGTKSWAVTNTGSVTAYVDMSIGVSASGTGHLEDYLGAQFSISPTGNIFSGPLSGASGSYDLNLPLAGGESKAIVLQWLVSSGYIPDENDEVRLTVNFSIQPAP